MIFGPRNIDDAKGAILAHSVALKDRRIRKGTTLNAADIEDLRAAGVLSITVAALGPGDVHEDAAAQMLAKALMSGGANLGASAPFTGRVNIFAECDGMFRVNADLVNRFNGVDPSITVATLPDLSRVSGRALVATVKIIPFAATRENISAACDVAAGALGVEPFKPTRATLILTRTPGMADRLLEKGHRAVAQRLHSLGCELDGPVIVDHKTDDLAAQLTRAKNDLILILTGSATSDIADVAPAALLAAGGRVERFGMPVDPGNLLFLGGLGTKTVVGLPGCARSPALNGADWVLERLAAGIKVRDQDIAAMGVGGLLKEISTRPQPRGGIVKTKGQPKIEVLLLAAGASSRMGGDDKLLQDVDGQPLLRHCANVALSSQAGRVNVVLPPDHAGRIAAIRGLKVNTIFSPDWRDGMSASIRAGLGQVSPDCDGVIIALADMPEITADHLNRLIAAFSPQDAREICRAVADDGTPGHPVLFGRRFFEALTGLHGDRGARDVLADGGEFMVDVATPGRGALVDLDTPQDWEKWRETRKL